jgi:hypothetical protein
MEAFMFKKTFFLMLSVIAILPFAGQMSAATQEIKASDDSLAFFWGWGRGFGFGGGYGGYYPSYGYGYGSYYPYSYGYGGYGYGGGCCY